MEHMGMICWKSLIVVLLSIFGSHSTWESHCFIVISLGHHWVVFYGSNPYDNFRGWTNQPFETTISWFWMFRMNFQMFSNKLHALYNMNLQPFTLTNLPVFFVSCKSWVVNSLNSTDNSTQLTQVSAFVGSGNCSPCFSFKRSNFTVTLA